MRPPVENLWFHWVVSLFENHTLRFVFVAVFLREGKPLSCSRSLFHSFSLAKALPEATHVLPKHAMRLLRRTQPCGTAALPPRPLRRALLHTRSHTTLTPALRPSRAQRIPSCAGVRARRLTPLVSSCVEPPQPFWPLPRPYCTTSHAMIVCTSWLHSALRTTRVPLAPRFTATPTAARTLGPGRQVVSPRGLATWP